MSQAFRMRVETTFAAAEDSRDAWDAAVAAMGANIYLTFDWARTWWETYGDGRPLRLYLFYHGDDLVAVLPSYTDQIGLPPLRLSVQRIVGACMTPHLLHPPVDSAHARQVFALWLDDLFGRALCDAVSFGPCSETYGGLGILAEVASRHASGTLRVTDASRGVHTLFSLPDQYDLYMQSLGKRERKKRSLYELRRLGNEHEIQVEMLRDRADVMPAFEEFSELHAAQWQGVGKLGHFRSWPRGLEFNQALAERMSTLGRARLLRIRADGLTIWMEYAFTFANKYYAILPARRVGPEWDVYRLGQAGLVTLIRHAIDERCTSLDGGRGHYEYKLRFGATEYAIRQVRIVGNRIRSRIGVRVVLLLHAILEIVYNKILYRRIMPRFPARLRRGQWGVYLRTDL